MNKKNRLRRTMMFLNAQKPTLLKDPFIYGPDSLIFDLEDAVAPEEKDAARFVLAHALKKVDYHNCEKVVRINGIDTPYWKEDIRCAVFAGCDSIRIPKTESAEGVKQFGNMSRGILKRFLDKRVTLTNLCTP